MNATQWLVLASVGLPTVVYSQSEPQADSSANNDSVEVVITPKTGQDSTIVKVGTMKIVVLNHSDKDKQAIIIDREIDIDEDDIEVDSNDSEKSKKCGDDPVSHWSGIRIGVNGYLHKNGLPIPATHSFLELDYAKSLQVDLNLFEKDFRIYKNNVELVTGLGLRWNAYAFESRFTTLQYGNPLTASVDSTYQLTKNKLKATYITAPLMLGFSTHQDEDKAFRFATGVQAGWRIGSKLKQEFTQTGETYTPKVKSDFNLNPFLFQAIATVGYGPMNVFAGYGLNTLFERGKTIAVTPFDVGLQLMF